MTRFKLGIMNYFAVRRWVEPEEWTEIIGADFDLNIVQFCFDLLDPKSNQYALSEVTGRILDSLKRYNLSMPCCINGFIGYSQNMLLHPIKSLRLDALNWWENAIALSSHLGAKTCGGYLGTLSTRDIQNEQRRTCLEMNLIKDLSHLSNIAFSFNQESFIIEPMAFSSEFPTTMSETDRILQKLDNKSKIPIKLLLDVGHPYGQGHPENEKDTYKWLNNYASKSYCVHLQQTDKIGDRHWPFTEEYNKTGLISGEKVIESIEKSGITDCLLILEIVHPFGATDKQVIEDHKITINYWKNNLGV